eukprot:COSAG03_NODE_18615_length_351_cov_1.226190_1_plen_81_part_01
MPCCYISRAQDQTKAEACAELECGSDRCSPDRKGGCHQGLLAATMGGPVFLRDLLQQLFAVVAHPQEWQRCCWCTSSRHST